MRRSCQYITCLSVIGLCVALAGCAQKAPTPGGANNSRAEKSRKDAESLAVTGFNSGASAQAKFVTVEEKASFVHVRTGTNDGTKERTETKLTPQSSPRPGVGPIVIRERVSSKAPDINELKAEEDAIAQACEVVARKLAELDPPVHYKPSPNEMKGEKGYLRQDSRTVRQPDAEEQKILAELKLNGTPVYVEYDVEVSANHVRELRTQARVATGLRIAGILLAVCLAVFLFLRADEWTKGYLTNWLALAAVTLAGGTAAALIFI